MIWYATTANASNTYYFGECQMQEEYQKSIRASLTLRPVEGNAVTLATFHPTSVLTSVIALTPLHMAFTYVRVCLLYQIGSIHLGITP